MPSYEGLMPVYGSDNAINDYTKTLGDADSYMYSVQHAKDLHLASLPKEEVVDEEIQIDAFGMSISLPEESNGIPEDMNLGYTPDIQLGEEKEEPFAEKAFNALPDFAQKLVYPYAAPLFENPVAQGITIGLTEAGNGLLDIARDFNNFVVEGNGEEGIAEEDWLKIPEILATNPDSTTQGVVRGLTQFMSIFSGLGGMKQAGVGFTKGQQLFRQMWTGGLADASFSPEEGNLSTLINELDLVDDDSKLGALAEWLGTPVGEDATTLERLEQRAKTVLEGAGLGGFVNGLMHSLKFVKRSMVEASPDQYMEILGKAGVPDPRSFIVDNSSMSINSIDVGEMFSNKIEVEGVLKNKINVSEYRKISGGSVRNVHQISDDKVVKVANHPRGLEQNYLATDGFLMNNEHWPEVFETGKDYVVAEYVPRNDKVANQYLKPLKKFTTQDWNNKVPELQKAMEEMGLDDFLNYNLLWNDFKSVRNWGVRKDGTVVLVDEGAISDQITASSKVDNFTKQEWEDVKQARRSAKSGDTD